MTNLIERVKNWIDQDPDPETRDELAALVEEGDTDELAGRMNGTLEFGTAGIRGAVEAGSNRMNAAVVIRTTAGLADFLIARHDGPPTSPVVVGFDARLSSQGFAGATVGVLCAAGIPVRYFASPVPTPIVAFAAKHLGAAAAIVITASHNPPADNGYKVFDENAAQIVPPVDKQIAASIAEVGEASAVPRVEKPIEDGHELAAELGPEVYEAYWHEVSVERPDVDGDRDLRIVYTPIHGVGWRYVDETLRRGGYGNVFAVPEQKEPDGRFPTVDFPNPEEPGALDLAFKLAEDKEAELIVANDPDVDRLAAAIITSAGWTSLTGNQIGVLLADWILTHWRHTERPIVINSIVSTPMLASVAERHGAHFETTLTGFKWIANAALDLKKAGIGRFAFGFEEALGSTVGQTVRDKDGIAAGLVFADIAAYEKKQGRTLANRLADLYRSDGLWVSTQESIVRPGSEGLAEIAAAMDRLAQDLPTKLTGHRVTESIDYRTGAEERPRWLGETALVALTLEPTGRVLVRPSGTEPKLKVYVDLRGEVGDDVAGSAAQARDKADAVATAMTTYLDL
ncbi:MAG: phospho-sugar mutase [Acidimicrobiia bacterium]|nr:phospho-sugar mutase [Acidimicrobiia bacterium]